MSCGTGEWVADGQIDFFISRAGADAVVAQRIDAILREAGYTTILQDWDFGHADFVAKMDDAIRRCRRTVTLLSHAYLGSEYCGVEWRAAFSRDPRNFGQAVALLRVTECQPIGILCVYAYTDLVPILDNDDLLRSVVLARLDAARRASAQDAAFPYHSDARPVVHSRIGYVENFTGREAALRSLDEALTAGQTVAVTRGVSGLSAKPAAVHGMGGVGKSALAREFAWRNRDGYAGVWWVNAASEATLIDDLIELGAQFVRGLDAAQDRSSAARVTLDRVLPATTKPWLLIYDNLESERLLKEWAPRENAHLIVTSRFSAYPASVQKIDVDVWPRPESIDYLKAQSGRRDLDDIEVNAIADALGDLPLALSHAAAYLRYNVTVDAKRYLNGISRRMAEAPIDDKDGRSVYATFTTALEAIEREVPGATAIMRLSAFVAPTNVPEELFSQDARLYPADAQPLFGDPDRLTQALGALDRYSLIRFRADQRSFSQHRLVQAATQAIADPIGQWLASTLEALSAAFPYVELSTWPACRRLVTHAQAMMPHTDRAIAAVPNVASACARVLSQAGYFLNEQARHREAEPLIRRSLAINEAIYGPDHPSMARGLNNLASLLEATNRLAEAEPLYRRSLAIDEASYGPDHPNVSIRLNNLAGLLEATNRLAEAEPLYRRSLAIAEASYGPDHPNVAIRLNNFAGLLEATNRLTEAEPLYRRSLAIDEASYGPDHPSVARDLNNLAGLLRATNRLAEAEPLYRRSLTIAEASYEPDHPNVARGLNNLASLLRATNRLAEAEPLYRRSLAIAEASYGPDHPDVAIHLNNLASLLEATNRLAEAEPLYWRSLAIAEASYGPDHPNVAIRLNNLAGLLYATNRLVEAEPLYRRSLAIDEASYGPDHPSVARGLNNLAGLLEATNRLAEAGAAVSAFAGDRRGELRAQPPERGERPEQPRRLAASDEPAGRGGAAVSALAGDHRGELRARPP